MAFQDHEPHRPSWSGLLAFQWLGHQGTFAYQIRTADVLAGGFGLRWLRQWRLRFNSRPVIAPESLCLALSTLERFSDRCAGV